jgi:uncharacterized protein YraI
MFPYKIRLSMFSIIILLWTATICRHAPSFMNIYEMRRFLFKALLGFLTVMASGSAMFLSPDQAGAFQGASTPSGIFVTVTYTEPINVRSGPSTVYYPIVGQLFPGDISPALGVSPGREWVQIVYSDAPGGVGWVYAAYVAVSGGELRVVEPPPTPTPLATATVDPTLAAAFNFEPTSTRIPTFTPPPPLSIPQFTDTTVRRPLGIPSGVLVISLALMGAVGLLVSFVLRRQ